MRNNRLFTCLLLFTPVLLGSSAVAQTDSLGLAVQLTARGPYAVSAPSFSGDTIVFTGVTPSDNIAVYVFQRPAGGWVDRTQTSKLTPSEETGLGDAKISGGTVILNDAYGAYVFVKPEAGWRDSSETAKLTVQDSITQFFPLASVDGDTVVISSQSSAYVFIKPASGWVSTTHHAAKLSPPEGVDMRIASVAISGDTIVMGGQIKVGSSTSGAVYVYQKPTAGWAGTVLPSATLTSTHSYFGIIDATVAISGDTVAFGNQGAVDLFVKPESGWADAKETVELVPWENNTWTVGSTLSLDSSHLVVSTSSDEFLVYSKPTAGWAAARWPSQVFVGPPNTAFGGGAALQGDTIVAAGTCNPIAADQCADYVFKLEPNPMLVSTDFLRFPDMAFGSSEVMPLTIRNSGTSLLNFTSVFNQANYQVLETAENTCSTGIPAGGSCVLPVEFNPSGVGQHTHDLTLTSPGTASLRIVQLQGKATGVGPAREQSLNFQPVPAGEAETLPLTLTNYGEPGSPTVAVSFSNPSFSLKSAGTCTAGISEGESCTLTIQFLSAAKGGQNGQIVITPITGAPSKVPVSGSTY